MIAANYLLLSPFAALVAAQSRGTLPTTTITTTGSGTRAKKSSTQPTQGGETEEDGLLEDPTTSTISATGMAGPTQVGATTTSTSRLPQGATTTSTAVTEATESEHSDNIDPTRNGSLPATTGVPPSTFATTSMAAQDTSATVAQPTQPQTTATTVQTQPQFTQWKLREFEVTMPLDGSDAKVEIVTDALREGMTTYVEKRYDSLQGLDLYMVQMRENILRYAGSAKFDAADTQVVHNVQIWQAQQDFLEAFLVDTRRSQGVMSIRLENGIVIGETSSTTLSDPAEGNNDRSADATLTASISAEAKSGAGREQWPIHMVLIVAAFLTLGVGFA